jgi:hypothetical protein
MDVAGIDEKADGIVGMIARFKILKNIEYFLTF